VEAVVEMSRCELCGGEGAYFVCSRCNLKVCSNCFNSKRSLCVRCSEDVGEISRLEGLLQPFGGSMLLGVFLIVAGMLLMMVASVVSGFEGGAIIVPPFFIWTVEGTTALIIMILMMVAALLMVFLPWILEPGRAIRVAEKALDMEGETGQAEDYIITLRMPGFREEDIEVQTFAESLTVRAYRGGELVFSRSYSLPRGTTPEKVRYHCEDGFLVIKVSLRRERGDGENQTI